MLALCLCTGSYDAWNSGPYSLTRITFRLWLVVADQPLPTKVWATDDHISHPIRYQTRKRRPHQREKSSQGPLEWYECSTTLPSLDIVGPV